MASIVGFFLFFKPATFLTLLFLLLPLNKLLGDLHSLFQRPLLSATDALRGFMTNSAFSSSSGEITVTAGPVSKLVPLQLLCHISLLPKSISSRFNTQVSE